MSFGEDYQGMDDRQILVEVATRLKGVEGKVDAIQCPSPKCANHEKRINILETKGEDKETTSSNSIAYIGLILGAIDALAVVIMLFRGG